MYTAENAGQFLHRWIREIFDVDAENTMRNVCEQRENVKAKLCEKEIYA